MTNHSNFITLPLDNLNTVTGGYHDADPPKPPAPAPTGAQAVGAAAGAVITGGLLPQLGGC